MSRADLSVHQVRRLALVAQGFSDPIRAGVPDRRALRRVIKRTGLFQIDSVNVLARAHYLPLFSRLGAYPTTLLDQAAYTHSVRAPRELFEYWGHEASLLPVDAHPFLRWRMAETDVTAWGGVRRIMAERPTFVADVLAEVERSGPISAGEIEALHGGRTRRAGPWWDWSHVKQALEFLFWSGAITTASRRGFERLYDVPERVIPARILALPTPDRAEAQRELIRRASRSFGVATEKDLRDYYRLGLADAKAAVASLVEDGALIPVAIEGWRSAGYLDPAAVIPRRVNARALIAPFDPLVWERDRAERLFGFRYRIEIYVPAPQRVHGYYVLPFLLGDQLVARVDLKADRQAGVLRVQAAYGEVGAPGETGEELAAELQQLAGWLGLGAVEVTGRGDLGPQLAVEVGRH